MRATKNHEPTATNTATTTSSLAPFVGLFACMATLTCCALPALLVTLGMGSSLAALISSAPFLVTLSAHKIYVFAIAGTLLLGATWIHRQNKYKACPADPQKAKACATLRKIGSVVLVIAWLTYAIGFFFAFLAVHIFY